MGILGKSLAGKEIVRHSRLFDELLPSKQNSKFLDIGSGAGIPGLILAQIQKDKNWVLCEQSIKKADFLRWAIEILKLENVEVENKSIEEIKFKFDGITGRLFAPPAITFEVVLMLLENNGIAVISADPEFSGWEATQEPEFEKNIGAMVQYVSTQCNKKNYNFVKISKSFQNVVLKQRSIKNMRKNPFWS